MIGKILKFLLVPAILLGLAFALWQYQQPISDAVSPAETGAPATQEPTEPEETTATPTAVPVETTTQPALQLPILETIDTDVMPGAAGSSLRAVQVAVKVLDWGWNTGLDTDEIRQAAADWLAGKDEARREEFQMKLELVDDAYNRLLTDEAGELLDVAGCQDTEIFWGSAPVEPVEAIMDAAGLRG